MIVLNYSNIFIDQELLNSLILHGFTFEKIDDRPKAYIINSFMVVQNHVNECGIEIPTVNQVFDWFKRHHNLQFIADYRDSSYKVKIGTGEIIKEYTNKSFFDGINIGILTMIEYIQQKNYK